MCFTWDALAGASKVTKLLPTSVSAKSFDRSSGYFIKWSFDRAANDKEYFLAGAGTAFASGNPLAPYKQITQNVAKVRVCDTMVTQVFYTWCPRKT